MAIGPGEIGARIPAARLAKGWTQLAFALEAHVSPATVQRWERGQLPRVTELIRVADVLGVPAEELVETPADPRVEELVAERLKRLEVGQARSERLLRELLRRLPRDPVETTDGRLQERV